MTQVGLRFGHTDATQPVQLQRPKARHRIRNTLFVIAATLGVASAAGGTYYNTQIKPRLATAEGYNRVDEITRLQDEEGNVTGIILKTPGVAQNIIFDAARYNVRVSTGVDDNGQFHFGSGVILRDGIGQFFVLTNHHVIDNRPVTIQNGKRLFNIHTSDPNLESPVQAPVFATTKLPDLALLKLPDGITPTHYLDISQLRDIRQHPLQLGEPVFIVGNPKGLRDTVTTGIISSTDARRNTELKRIEAYRNAIEQYGLPGTVFVQTDAWCEGGGSGGALYDAQGRLVGLHTWHLAKDTNLCFAIRVDEIRQMLTDSGITPLSAQPATLETA